jgi:hypothetical protein
MRDNRGEIRSHIKVLLKQLWAPTYHAARQ